MSGGTDAGLGEGGAPARAPKGAILAAFAAIYLIWGSTYLGIRVGVETIPPFLMAASRFAIAGVVLFTVLRLRGAPWPTLLQWRDQAVVGVFLLLGGNSVVTWCELRVPSGITSLVLGAGPIIVLALNWIRPGGSRPTAKLAVGVLIGVAGLVILLGPGSIPAGYRPPLSRIFILLASSLCWWTGSFYSKHRAVRTPLIMASAMQMICGSLCIFLAAQFLDRESGFSLSHVSGRSWIAFAYLTTVGSAVVFPIYVWLLGHTTPAKASTFAYVNPVIAIILGWAILREPLNFRIALATAIIIGAVVLINLTRAKPRDA
ncbi:MAG TPA: EamA family transporter [Opitutaceae bacterium]|jgi:drug/metabolite transporter (DMT)-like permease